MFFISIIDKKNKRLQINLQPLHTHIPALQGYASILLAMPSLALLKIQALSFTKAPVGVFGY
jgi:hypothetical protein